MLDDSKTAALDAAARAVAEAEAAEADLRPAAEAAARDLVEIDGRISDLAAARNAIKARRAAGKICAGDSAELLTLALDAENLTEMRAHAADGEENARRALDAASTATASARAAFSRVERRVAHDALHERTIALLRLAEAAQKAAAAALAVLDRPDAVEARRGLAEMAALTEALHLHSAKNMWAHDERLKRGGSFGVPPRFLFKPSIELQNSLHAVSINGPFK